jgi:hypothetical protein
MRFGWLAQPQLKSFYRLGQLRPLIAIAAQTLNLILCPSGLGRRQAVNNRNQDKLTRVIFSFFSFKLCTI